MFLYKLNDQEITCILQHEKPYSNEEFAQMCNEAEKYYLGCDRYCDDISTIEEYLIEKYSF